MKVGDFEAMLEEAELHPQRLETHVDVAWSVLVHRYELWGQDVHLGWLMYQPAEFAMMTLKQAESKIAACKALLGRTT